MPAQTLETGLNDPPSEKEMGTETETQRQRQRQRRVFSKETRMQLEKTDNKK
jgi:hypothetical protein